MCSTILCLRFLTDLHFVEQVHAELPWYSDLNAIWHSNPSFAAKTHSSKPGVDHAANLYALVRPARGGAGSSTYRGAADVQPPHSAYLDSAAQPPHNAYPTSTQPPHGAYPTSAMQPPRSVYPTSTQSPQGASPAGTMQPPHSPYPTSAMQPISAQPGPGSPWPGAEGMYSGNDPPIDPHLLQPAPATPPCANNASPAIDLRDLPGNIPPNFDDDDDDDDDDNLYADQPEPEPNSFTAPLRNALDHEDDYMMHDDTQARVQAHDISLNSPPRVSGKKRQLATSPSPPPDPPFPFAFPQKSPTPFYDSRAAFGTQRSSGRGAHRRPSSIASSGMSRSMSTPSSTTRNTSSSDLHISPTSQTSLSVVTKKKKAKSDIQQQVDNINDEIQSSIMSRHDSKNERFAMKLDAKRDYIREAKKYEWLREARSHEVMQADVNHRRAQEAKDADIRLREVDVRAHEAETLKLEKEAETWRLKIQFHQMMQGGGNMSTSDGGQSN